MPYSPDQFCGHCGNPRVPGQWLCPHCRSPYDEAYPPSQENLQGSTKITPPMGAFTPYQPNWRSSYLSQFPGMMPPTDSSNIPTPTLDLMSLPGKWGQRVTVGAFIVMLGDFGIHVFQSFSEGQTTTTLWWMLAVISSLFLLGEKVVSGWKTKAKRSGSFPY